MTKEIMTKEKTPTLEELEAALRHYDSYYAAIHSVEKERDKHLWKIKQAIRKYLIDEQILKGMEFKVNEGYHRSGELVLTHDSPDIPLVKMLESDFSFKHWYLMNFERKDAEDGYEPAYLEVNRWSLTIMLPKDITKEELKKLKDTYGFTIDTCSFSESICTAKERIKYFEERLDRFG